MKLKRYMRWILPAFLLCAAAITSHAQISISVTVAPPVLPVYEQPPCPEEGLMWVPGYWAWEQDSGYYWVPGEWVPAPYVGAMWTPPWWAWDNGRYLFHQGYWGNDVGYYGGINYGYGYMGVGFAGGEWRSGRFAYNTAVVRVNRTVIHNTYVNETIVHNNTIVDERRVAYNGGPSGIRHEPTPVERRAMSVSHTPPTQVQQQRIEAARADRNSFAKVNGGRPTTPVVARPQEGTRNGEAARPGTTAPVRSEPHPDARQAPVTRTEPNRPETRPAPTEHPGTATRPEPAPRTESRPVPTHTEPRPAPVPHTESRPAPESRPESQTTPQQPRETHSAPEPRQESRPEVQPRTEPHPVPQSTRETHPAPETRQATPPRTEAHPAPAPHTEAHPAPQHESHPAPQHESRPAPPQHESHPAPAPKPEKSKPEPH